MHRGALLILLSCLSVPIAAPNAEAMRLGYTIYVLGVPVAEAALSVDLTASSYAIAMRYHTVGVIEVVSADHLEEHSSGRFEEGRPAPFEYASNGHLRGQYRVVGLTWRGDAPIVTEITPPDETERETVPVALRARTMDPLSSIVLLLHQVAQTGRCEATARTYDGRRLQLFEATTVGEEAVPRSRRSSFAGRGLRCEYTDRTLAGVRLGANRADSLRERRGTIWLARVAPATVSMPVRASVETRWLGAAMIYLTSASP